MTIPVTLPFRARLRRVFGRAAYYVAPSLDELLREYNAAFPNRPTASDGALGNASHAAGVSDHNPDWAHGGVIRARDFCTTMAGGSAWNSDRRAGHATLTRAQQVAVIRDLIATELRNPVDRIWYIIHWLPGDPYPTIWSRTTGWEPKRYHGPSPHDHHFHVSLMHTRSAERDCKPWFSTVGTHEKPAPDPLPAPAGPAKPRPVYPHPDGPAVVYLDRVKPGVRRSDSVWWVQTALAALGYYHGVPTATYGPGTIAAAKKYQAAKGDDVVDGVLGLYDLAALFADANIAGVVKESSL